MSSDRFRSPGPQPLAQVYDLMLIHKAAVQLGNLIFVIFKPRIDLK